MSPYNFKRIAGFALLGAIVIPVAVWHLGAICYRHESYDVYQDNAFSGSRRGTALGPKQFYLREGQTLVLSYSATIKKGTIDFHFAKPLQPIGKTNDHKLKTVTTSGAGEVRYPIHKSGFYRVSTWTHRDRDLCHLSYTATWSTQ